jgi:hypothetical protein
MGALTVPPVPSIQNVAVETPEIFSNEAHIANMNEDTPDEFFGLLGIFPNKKKRKKEEEESKGGKGGGKGGMGMMGMRSRGLASVQDTPEDFFGLLGIFPKKKKRKKEEEEEEGKGGKGGSKGGMMGMRSRGLKVTTDHTVKDVETLFDTLSDEEKSRALQYAQEGHHEMLLSKLFGAA